LQESKSRVTVEISGRLLSLRELEAALNSFVLEDSEGGKTGQALGAAVLDLVFTDVRAKRVNDPSVKWPGDVGIFVENELIEPVEVRQKAISETDLFLFAQHVSDAGIHRGLVLAFGQGESLLDVERAKAKVADIYKVELGVFQRPGDLLREALR